MATVPRLRDTLQFVRLGDRPADEVQVLDAAGAELFRITAEGHFIVRQLDGLIDDEELRRRYFNHFGRELDVETLSEYLDGLSDAGVLTTAPRAVRILSYLREQGVRYRSGQPDRRVDAEDDRIDQAPRRADESTERPWFDLGIYHLNDGDLDRGLHIFRQISRARPDDLRIREIIKHLEFLDAQEQHGLSHERRDVSWDAFDDALADLLSQGQCPRCGGAFDIVLGGTNLCPSCGAGFSAYVLQRADDQRGSSQ